MANDIIATVASINGTAYARDADGELRTLRAGELLREGENLVTPAGSTVELTLADGSPLSVTDTEEMTISRDLVTEYASGADESALQDESVQEVLLALEKGEDISEVLEPTAAGAEAAANEGHSFIRLGRILEQTEEFDGLIATGADADDIAPPVVNLVPVDAEDDAATTEEGVPVVIDVLENDNFLEGSNITAVTQAANGNVVVNEDGTITYIPDDGFIGTDEFTYTATSPDGTGQDSAQVNVEVVGEPVEPPPPENPPTISIGDDIVTEGGVARVDVTLSKAWDEPITVRFATSDGTATVIGGDYDPETGTVTFAPGETSVTLSIQTNDDELKEGEEEFNVSLSAPQNASIADGAGVVTIEDAFSPPPEEPPPPPPPPTREDPVASIVLDPVAGDDNVALGEVDGVLTLFITGTVGGDARPGDEITLVFTDGSTFSTIVAADKSYSLEIDVRAILSNTSVSATVTGTDGFGNPYSAEASRIYDIDIPQKVVAIDNVSEFEGDDLVFEVTLHPLSFYADEGVHTFELTDITTTPVDYGAISFGSGVIDNNDGTITVAAGLTTFTVTVAGAEDLFSEPDETFTLNIDGVEGATGTGEILDDDGAPRISISDAGEVEEGGIATFTVTLSNPSAEIVTVEFTTVDGVATLAGDDYVANSGTLVFNPGETSRQIQVQTNDDFLGEGSENFFVELSNVSSTASIVKAQGEASIVDEPNPGPEDTVYANITVDLDSVDEGGQLTYTVSLVDEAGDPADVPAGKTVTVELDWSGVATPGVDTSALPATVDVTGGNQAQFVIDAIDDYIAEGSESLIATITDVTDAQGAFEAMDTGANNIATSAITDEPNPGPEDTVYANIIVDLDSVDEGGQLTYTVSLVDEAGDPADVPAGKTVTVELDWSGMATPGVDTSALPATVDVTGGNQTQFVIDAIDDYLAEGSESLIATITDVTDAQGAFEAVDTGANNIAASAITDEPNPGPEDTVYANIVVDLASFPEGTQATYTVSLVDNNNDPVSVPAGETVTVELDWSGVATPGVDTSALPATVDVTGGNQAQFVIDAIDDYIAEGSESLIATITDVTDVHGNYEAVAIGANGVADSAITDEPNPGPEDTVYANIIVDLDSVDEGGQLTYTVSLVDEAGDPADVPAGKTVTVELDWSGMATPGVDTSALPATVDVTGGNQTQFVIDAIDDYLAEGSESLIATITDVTDAQGAFEAVDTGANNIAASAITDEPNPGPEDTVYANIVVDLASFPEGTQATYTVSLVDNNNDPVSVPAGETVTVELDWSGVATPGVDTSALPATVDVTGGNQAQFVIDAIDDYIAEGSESLIATITDVTDVHGNYEAVAIGANGVADSAITDEPNPGPEDTVYANIIVDLDSVDEGGQLTYTVSLVDEAGDPADVPAGKTVTVELDWSGMATPGVDTSALPATVDVTGGNQTQFVIDAIDDYLAEGSESLIATITDVTDAQGAFEAVDTGANNIAASAITDEPNPGPEDTVYANIVVDLASFPEGTQATYTVSLVDNNNDPVSVPAGETVTVELDWSGVATPGVDTSALPATVDVTGGNQAQFVIDAIDDYIAEGSESLIATITDVTDVHGNYEAVAIGANGVADSAITDEPNPGPEDTVYANIIVDLDSVDEGGQLTYTVSLVDEAGDPADVPAGKTVTVELDWSGPAAGGADTSTLPASVDVDNGSSVQFTVDALNDGLFEGDEALIAEITAVTDNNNSFEAVDIGAVSTANSLILDLDVDRPVLVSDSTSNPVEESDMPLGNPGGPDFPVATGTFSFTTQDGFGSLSITGQNGNVSFASFAALTAAIGAGAFDIGEHGTLELLGASGAPETGMTIDYAYTLTSPEYHPQVPPSDPVSMGADDGWDVFTLDVVDAGAGPDNSASAEIKVEIIDDEPLTHDPDSTLVVDGSDVPGTPIDLHFSDTAGADGVGSLTFAQVSDGDIARDVHGYVLSLGVERLYTFVSDDGMTLWVATADPEGQEPATVALTVEISGDTYTVRGNNGEIFNGSELSSADLTTVGGGNTNPKIMIDPFEVQSDLDILITGAGGSGSNNDNTVNSNNGQLGVGTGQDIDFDDGDPAGDKLRLEFGNIQAGGSLVPDPERVTVNRFLLPIENASNGSVDIEVFFHDPDNGFAETAINFTVWDATGTTQLTYPDDLQGLNSDTTVMIIADQNFDTLEISHANDQGEGSFKIGEFSLTQYNEGEPIHMRYAVDGIDGDEDGIVADAVQADINFSVISGSDNIVHASSSDDVLAASEANDIFVWELADAGTTADPSNDIITDFRTEGGDVLDVRDLLQLDAAGSGDAIGNLLEYLHVSESDGDTVLHISSSGGFSGGVFDSDQVDQTITLQDVDLGTGGSVSDIIEDMLSSGRLITD